MDRMGPGEARDHIEMIDRILAESQPRLCSGGEYFVVWGIISALITLCVALQQSLDLPSAVLAIIPVLIVAGALFSILRGRRTRRDLTRSSLLQREYFNVLMLTVGAALVVNVAGFRIFSGLASAGIWSVAEAIVLLYIGMHGNRRARIAGGVMAASLIVANVVAMNFDEAYAAYVLAAGMLFGYAGFGLSELFARD